MRIINGSVFVGEGFVERDVFVAEGRFVGEAARAEGGQTVDAAGCYVIPGLVDLHFHGSAGADISDGDLAGLHRMGAYEASRGVTVTVTVAAPLAGTVTESDEKVRSMPCPAQFVEWRANSMFSTFSDSACPPSV